MRPASVPIADLFSPMIRSPSQWPGTARSAAWAGPGADHHLGGEHAVAALPGPGPRHPQRPAGAQAGDQLALERPAALDIQGLVDRLVRHAHGLIIREIDRQPAAICSGLHAVAQCRSWRGPWRRPLNVVTGPATGLPSGARIAPASRSCTYSRSRSLAASFETLGRRARRSACVNS
jgi:hypothetical protein